jgi:hypothetical protein
LAILSRLGLAALANQFPDFFLHQQIHQPQTPPDLHPRPLPQAASQLAEFQFGMVSS